MVFPNADEIYPRGVPEQAEVSDYGSLTHCWEAAHRPGHFDGVVAVVRTLFEATKPTHAYFGAKRTGSNWPSFPQVGAPGFSGLAIVPVPTCGKPDGLAMSSSNVRLSPSDRCSAAVLHGAL